MENCVLLTSVQEFTEIEAWLLPILFLSLHNQLISIHSTVRSLKNVIHKINRNEWLLHSAF